MALEDEKPREAQTFAEQLEQNEAIKVYAKLPGWFRVPTPLGYYNVDFHLKLSHFWG